MMNIMLHSIDRRLNMWLTEQARFILHLEGALRWGEKGSITPGAFPFNDVLAVFQNMY